MRVVTLNLNGVRSATAKGVVPWLAASGADVICLQEVRAFPEQVPAAWQALDYHLVWHSAVRPGYSGVALLAKMKPARIVPGMKSTFDAEGRVLQADFGAVSVVSVYVPSGTSSTARLALKFQFMREFLAYCRRLLRKRGRELILCGDFNVAHQKIDLKNWRGNQKNSGFLPEERAWVDELLALGLHDTYRQLIGPEAAHYSWWSNRGNARANNVGWRIDYQFSTAGALHAAHSPAIYTGQWFSDHAPVTIDYDL